MHWIPIIDAGIAQRQGYDAYEDGMSQDVFIKSFDNQTVEALAKEVCLRIKNNTLTMEKDIELAQLVADSCFNN